MYAPQLGRFISRDPLVYSDGPNLYEFTRNNPIAFLDPAGTSIKDCPKNQRRPKPGYRPTFNGCGDIKTRWIVPQFAVLWAGYFEPACNNHDICYGTCNSDKHQCDIILEAEIRVACLEFWDSLPWLQKANPAAWALLDFCYLEATLYYEAVNEFGQGPYDSAQEEACICCNS